MDTISCNRLKYKRFYYDLVSYTGHGLGLTDILADELVPDLPGKDAGRLHLVAADAVHHGQGRHPGLGAADRLGADGARLVVTSDVLLIGGIIGD